MKSRCKLKLAPRLAVAQKLHVGVSAQSHVIGQVPARVVWVVVDYDLVAIP